jgi:hypothetical protein
MALQHAGEAVAHLLGRLADRDVRVTSVVPSAYWPPESTR